MKRKERDCLKSKAEKRRTEGREPKASEEEGETKKKEREGEKGERNAKESAEEKGIEGKKAKNLKKLKEGKDGSKGSNPKEGEGKGKERGRQAIHFLTLPSASLQSERLPSFLQEALQLYYSFLSLNAQI